MFLIIFTYNGDLCALLGDLPGWRLEIDIDFGIDEQCANWGVLAVWF